MAVWASKLLFSLLLCFGVLWCNCDPNAAQGQAAMHQQQQPPEPQHQVPPPQDHNQAGHNQAANQANTEDANQPLIGKTHLSSKQECQEDIKKYCPDMEKVSDVDMLVCLQEKTIETDFLTNACQHVIWQYKSALSTDERIRVAADQLCKEELAKYADCTHPSVGAGHSGDLLSCLLDHKDEMAKDGECTRFLTNVEMLIFSDYRLVGPFVKACSSDIQRTSCGRTDVNDIHAHSQGEVIECLMEKFIEETKGQPDGSVAKHNVSPGCQHELMRIAELQGDDFHLDRPLFFACRQDRERLCRDIKSGGGRVLQCLMQQRVEKKLSASCDQKVLLREEFMAKDYKAAHPLIRACNAEIAQHKCAPALQPVQAGQQQPELPMYYTLTYVLLCLENVLHNKQVPDLGAPAEQASALNAECRDQIFENRRILMSDYRIAPELVLNCAGEIHQHCNAVLEQGGRTIHCLMGAYEKAEREPEKIKFSAPCSKGLRDLIKTADIASDYRVDPELEQACGQAIDKLCPSKKVSEHDVLSCLMDNLEKEDINDECEERLMEVQYFIARDFTLDSKLLLACAKDAVTVCHADKRWAAADSLPHGQDKNQDQHPDPSGLVLPCLYRYAYLPEDHNGVRLNSICIHEIRRVMHERASSVRLLPQVEEKCIHDLARFCSDKVKDGEEMMCLQEKYDDKLMAPQCQEALLEFTEMESKDMKLNRLLFHACQPVMEKHCPEKLEAEVDSIEVLQCLLDNKETSEMTSQCHTYVRHYELISMKDYRFSQAFKTACQADVLKYCPHTPDAQAGAPGAKQDLEHIQDKGEVVRCLSNTMFEHALLENNRPLSDECQRQLRAEYLLMSEEVEDQPEIDPELEKACGADLKKHCNEDSEDRDRPMECLREKKEELSQACHEFIFKHEEVEFADNRMDYTLYKMCRSAIEALCSEEEEDEIVDCLIEHRDDPAVKGPCKKVVERRMLEQVSDIRLQPKLRNACKQEIDDHCKTEMDAIKDRKGDQDDNTNTVVLCLRKAFITSNRSLGTECRDEVKGLIIASELDPRLDPPLYRACIQDIHDNCHDPIMRGLGHGQIVECLNSLFYQTELKGEKAPGKSRVKSTAVIKSPDCINEMVRRTQEEVMDIHIDASLHEACSSDIVKFCSDVPSGQGRIIQCLLTASEDSSRNIFTPTCHGRLEERKKLWKVIFKGKLPMDIASLAQVVQESPARNAFLTILIVVVVILFVLGLLCGRVTKRVRRELKDR